MGVDLRSPDEVREDFRVLSCKRDLECEHCDGLGERRSPIAPSGHVTDTCEWCNGTGFKRRGPVRKVEDHLRDEYKRQLNTVLYRLILDMYALVAANKPDAALDEVWLEASGIASRVFEASILESTRRVSRVLRVEEYVMNKPLEYIFKLDSDE